VTRTNQEGNLLAIGCNFYFQRKGMVSLERTADAGVERGQERGIFMLL
jgi:hypothetical protein